jgi:hypothetical protein
VDADRANSGSHLAMASQRLAAALAMTAPREEEGYVIGR